MPYLIASDIHGNLEALEAVLADAAGRYDRILCLGDLVGYGADPNAIVDWARESVEAIVRGNHDKACIGIDPIEGYNAAAQKSALWTRGVLTPESVAYLDHLPRGPLPYVGRPEEPAAAPFDLVHGSPEDEDEYLIDPADVWPLRSSLATPATFFGHTHVQGGFVILSEGIQIIRGEGLLELSPDSLYLLNPGSIGQPRDRDPRAAYALYSPQERVVEYRRVAYDVARAAEKIRAAGLPESLALRLHEGI